MLSLSDLVFHQRLGKLAGQIGQDGFWAALLTFLRHEIPFNSAVALIFRANQSPQLLYEGDSDYDGDELFRQYISSFYLLDPFYAVAQEPFTPGLYCLDDVSPEHFRKTEYYQHYFSLNVFGDEVQYMLPFPPYGTLTLSLGSKRRFSDDELGLLHLYTPWLLPVLKIAAERRISSAGPAPNQGISLEEKLRQRGNGQLTDREVQTAILLLAGHSSKAIAARLAISPETVKVHRRNLYEKLNISSQAEIFSLFVPGIGGVTQNGN